MILQEMIKNKKTSGISIQIVNIDLYCDGNYPRGISILYNIDGQKTMQVTISFLVSPIDYFLKTSSLKVDWSNL